ncbi:hypothetical protein Hanom_Chr12g01164371 [Helianthus anomalus]
MIPFIFKSLHILSLQIHHLDERKIGERDRPLFSGDNPPAKHPLPSVYTVIARFEMFCTVIAAGWNSYTPPSSPVSRNPSSPSLNHID